MWSFAEPTVPPPGGNVSAPLNVSEKVGVKLGGLWLNTGGAAKGLIVESGGVDFGGLLNFTSADAALRRIANLGAPVDSADAATKSYVDAQVSGGAGNGCFLSQRTFKGNMGKSSANVACNAEGSGFSFAGKAQWYSRATAGVPVTAWVDGETNNCDNWTSSAAGKNGATIQWDTSAHRWSTPINSACDGYFSLACCNFANADAPMQPITLQGVNSREITAMLNWNDISDNETGFKVYKGTTPGFALASAEQVYPVDANATAFNAPQPNNAIRYYKVTAYNAKGESDPSNEVGVVTPAGVIAPSGLDWIQIRIGGILDGQNFYLGKFTWSDNSDLEANQKMEYCSTSFASPSECLLETSKYRELGTCSANATSMSVEKRYGGDNNKYYYRIKASTPGSPATDSWSNAISAGDKGWMYAFVGCL